MLTRKALSTLKAAIIIVLIIVAVSAAIYVTRITPSPPPPLTNSTSQVTSTLTNPYANLPNDTGAISKLPKATVGKLIWTSSAPPVPSTAKVNDEPPTTYVYVENSNFAGPTAAPLSLSNKSLSGDPPVLSANINVPCTGSCGYPGSYIEPSTANHGQVMFYTASYIGGASVDGGKTWKFTGQDAQGTVRDLNGDAQCGCDNDVVYSPQINMFIWYRQGGGNDWTKGQEEPNSLTLLDGNDPINGNACSVTLYPSTVNSAWGLVTNQTGTYAPYWFDYPKLDLGSSFVYLATDMLSNGVENPTGGVLWSGSEWSIMVRFNLEALKNYCFGQGGMPIDWYEHPWSGNAFGFAQDSTALGCGCEIWSVHMANDKLRVYTWPESSPDWHGVQAQDLSHSAYKPPWSGTNDYCTAPDAGNPCGIPTDHHLSDDITGWADVGAGTVSFAWTAGEQGRYSYPYIDVVTITQASMQVSGETQLWSPNFAAIYAAGGDNPNGKPIIVFYLAGGSTQPGTVVLVPGTLTYYWLNQGQGSGGKPTTRWGDYIRVRPYNGGAGGSWVAAGYVYNSTGIEPHLYELSTDQGMDFSVSVNPTSDSVNAGFMSTAQVTVTSLNGVVTSPITLSVAGMMQGIIGLGTEDLTGHGCNLQPVVGSTCSLTMHVTTYVTVPPSTWPLTIWAKTTSGNPILSANTQYTLTVLAPLGPTTVIVSPTNGTSFNPNQPYTLIGYAQVNQAQLIPSYVPCSEMQFNATSSDGSVQIETPTEDPSYATTGYCDAQMTFTVPGPLLIMLTAQVNGAVGTAYAEVSVGQVTTVTTGYTRTVQTSAFAFQISTATTGTIVTAQTPGTMTVIVTVTAGTPQAVQLTVSGLPTGASYTFSVNPVTPTTVVTLTITVGYNTPLAFPTPDMITITGTGGGYTASTTFNLYVEAVPG